MERIKGEGVGEAEGEAEEGEVEGDGRRGDLHLLPQTQIVLFRYEIIRTCVIQR